MVLVGNCAFSETMYLLLAPFHLQMAYRDYTTEETTDITKMEAERKPEEVDKPLTFAQANEAFDAAHECHLARHTKRHVMSLQFAATMVGKARQAQEASKVERAAQAAAEHLAHASAMKKLQRLKGHVQSLPRRESLEDRAGTAVAAANAVAAADAATGAGAAAAALGGVEGDGTKLSKSGSGSAKFASSAAACHVAGATGAAAARAVTAAAAASASAAAATAQSTVPSSPAVQGSFIPPTIAVTARTPSPSRNISTRSRSRPSSPRTSIGGGGSGFLGPPGGKPGGYSPTTNAPNRASDDLVVGAGGQGGVESEDFGDIKPPSPFAALRPSKKSIGGMLSGVTNRLRGKSKGADGSDVGNEHFLGE